MPSTHLELADYRRCVAEIYRQVSDSQHSPQSRWQQFRIEQDNLFKTHPQTALTPDQLANFTSLRYYPYNPALRFALPVERLIEQKVIEITLQDDGPTRLLSFGSISFPIHV